MPRFWRGITRPSRSQRALNGNQITKTICECTAYVRAGGQCLIQKVPSTMNLSPKSSDKTEKIICYGKGISHDNRINYSSSRIP